MCSRGFDSPSSFKFYGRLPQVPMVMIDTLFEMNRDKTWEHLFDCTFREVESYLRDDNTVPSLDDKDCLLFFRHVKKEIMRWHKGHYEQKFQEKLVCHCFKKKINDCEIIVTISNIFFYFFFRRGLL